MRLSRSCAQRWWRRVRAGRPFIASAARHSMGAQSLASVGTVATIDQQWIETDTANKTYRVGAGVRWSAIISRLDAIGFSPAVMQSNNDFGVASTFAVNARGWPVPFSGCGSTVREVTMLLPEGSTVKCSLQQVVRDYFVGAVLRGSTSL
jgi:FAD/FMN-containing dehydrogenase